MQAMVEEQLRLQQTNRALQDMDKQRVRRWSNNFLTEFFCPPADSDIFSIHEQQQIVLCNGACNQKEKC